MKFILTEEEYAKLNSDWYESGYNDKSDEDNELLVKVRNRIKDLEVLLIKHPSFSVSISRIITELKELIEEK